MIRIAIVEDEEEYINQFTQYLQEYQKPQMKKLMSLYTVMVMKLLLNISLNMISY